MLQLTYISTCRTQIDRPMLDDILTASRRNNDRTGISGLLLAGGRRFVQALEGPEREVMETYKRILADPRHFAAVELSRRTVEAREFGAWAMDYVRGGDAPAGADLRESVANLVAAIPSRNVQALFTGFAELHATKAA